MAQKDFIPAGELYLDTDTDPKINKGSDYILNTIITSDGRHGVAINYKGNELITLAPTHNNAITLMGSCPDHARNRIIICLYSTDNQTISYYDIDTGNTGLIINNGNYLNFNPSYLIFNPKVVGDLLYWTDNYNSPRKINYIRAYNYTNSVSTSYIYNYLNSNIIDAYKRPALPITVTPHQNTINLIKNKSYQWSYRFIFVDGEKSVLAGYTGIYFTNIYTYPNGSNYTTGIDYFTLYIFTDHTNNDISGLEIYIRDNEKSDWYLYDTIISPSENFYYTFDDKKLRIAADQVDLARPYDFLPQLAGQQELIEKNRIIYGDITEGFDPVTISVDVAIRYDNTNLETQSVTETYVTKKGTAPTDYYLLRYSNYVADSLYVIQLIAISSTSVITYIDARYLSKSGDTEVLILDYLAGILSTKGINTAQRVLDGSPLAQNIKFLRVNTTLTIYPQYITIFAYSYKQSWRIPKFGDTYLGSIRYFDKNFRFGSENKFTTPVSIPNYSDAAYTFLNIYQAPSLQVSIKNLPPADAYYYSIDFTKRIRIGDYWHILAMEEIDYFFGTSYGAESDGYLRVKVDNIINYARDNNNSLNIGSYVFEKGDRLRVIAKSDIYTAVTVSPRKYTKLHPFTFLLDEEILRVEWPLGDTRYSKDQATTPSYIIDATGNKMLSDSSSYIVVPLLYSQFGMPGSGNYIDLLFEIYKPKKASDNPYYYPGTIYAIGNPTLSNRYHIGQTQNQNPATPTTVPAIVMCNPGDTYLKLRDCKSVFVCTDDNYSDYYDSKFYGLGIPNVFDSNMKKDRYKSAMRYSGRLLENTKINELNKFEALAFVLLKSEFGTINCLKEIGDDLKVLQDKKETTIYIGREEMKHPDGSVTLISNDSVLGTQNRMDELRGTQYPRSAVVHNRNLYYWDGLRNEVIRSAPNGQFPVSTYGMITYFKNKTGYTDVVASFDETNSIYFITFIGGTSETLGFYDPDIQGIKPRWFFFSFIPSAYISLGKKLFASFYNGLYKHNSDSVNRCTFYGVKYKQQINFYFNANAAIKKIFRSIGIKSNKAWPIPIISIEADSSYSRGFLSKLNTNHFELKEGEYYADLLNNMYTTSAVASNLDLLNGDNLRGEYIKFEIENSENGECWLLGITVGHDPSLNY